jgi:hypothetical protein
MILKKCFEEEETTLSLVKESVFFRPDVGMAGRRHPDVGVANGRGTSCSPKAARDWQSQMLPF